MRKVADQDVIQVLMKNVPRGVSGRFLKEQRPPQARWEEPEKILASDELTYDPNNPQGKIMVGALGDKLIGIADNRHMLTVAGSRAGKSVTLIGNLFFYDGSVLCTDPKGELATKTAAARAKLGQNVMVLDPFSITEGDTARYRAAFNPMHGLTLDNPHVIEDAAQIADGLVLETGQEKDPHWNEEARGLIGGFILYVAVGGDHPEDERNLITVRRLLDTALQTGDIEDEDGNKKAVFILPRKIFNAARRLEQAGHRSIAAAMEGDIQGFYDKPNTERGSVLSNARRHTRFLTFEAMKGVLSGHDFDLEDLKSAPDGLSVFLCLPATRMGPCNRWLRVMINQLVDAMERERTKPKSPVLVALDEFPVLGFMRQIQDAAGQIASFHVKLWIIMQDWGQGTTLYGERFESFAANAGIFQAFGNVDVTTTEYISRKLGKTTIEASRIAEASQQQRESGLSGRSQSIELHDLMTADEIARYFARDDPFKRQLVIRAGKVAMILQRVEYYADWGPLKP